MFCRIQERTSLLEAIPSDEGSNMNFDEQAWVGPKRTKQPPPHDVQESQIPLAGGFTPSYEVNEASTASQEGLFSYPSTSTEQATLSDSADIKGKGSLDLSTFTIHRTHRSTIKITSSPYTSPSHIQNQPTPLICCRYHTMTGSFSSGFEFVWRLAQNCTDAVIVHR